LIASGLAVSFPFIWSNFIDQFLAYIYDALVVSAALEAGCTTLYSQDLHDGQTIDRQRTIRNPFLRASG
jgi:predicted nucleic acid-binding protein